jgi:uncharacterized protein (TIGR02391 family)
MKKAKNKRKKPEPKKRTLSASDRQNAIILAEKLGKIIPLTSHFKGSFTLQKILKAQGLNKYLPAKTSNKTEAITKFVENMMTYHPRTIKKVMRAILPEAIKKRHANGDPVLFEEAKRIADSLFEIGVDMRKEITEMNFPKNRPRIVPPPAVLQKMLKDFKLHPTMMPECEKLFIDGHINESVRKSLEKFESSVQRLASLQDEGAELIGKAFNETNPKIKLNSLVSKADKNEQDGYKMIGMGAMRWWRNSLSHGDEPQLPPQEAVGRLIAVSNLFRRLDERKNP